MPDGPGRLAVVSDLDGCLLDADTYALTPARSTLRRLRRADIPLALCTSKTRAEVVALWRRFGGRHVAVLEDGGGILVPPRVLRAPLPGARRTADGRLLPLGPPYARVRAALRDLGAADRPMVSGFGDMSPEEIQRETGLDAASARRAARREFDEPLRLHGGPRIFAAVRRAAARHGLILTRGGRFVHLHGRFDKGLATRRLRRLLEREHGPLHLIALGDSPLDAPMLRAADVAIIIPHPDGRADPTLRRLVPRARVAPAAGPSGWALAVNALLDAAGRPPLQV